jgi:hypothetical protein
MKATSKRLSVCTLVRASAGVTGLSRSRCRHGDQARHDTTRGVSDPALKRSAFVTDIIGIATRLSRMVTM